MAERTATIPYQMKGVDMKREIEVKDLDEAQAKFLAGIFEVGGGINMTTNPNYGRNGHRTDSVTPKGLIYYNDSDEAKIDFLQNIFGGTTRRHPKENSWRWTVYGYAADALLAQIKPYAPHRREAIEAFNKAYEPERDLDERLCIGEHLKAFTHAPKSYPDIEEYDGLKDDPYFLAGTLFGRGIDYSFKQDSPLRFWSQNPVVLAAIGEPYGLEPYAIINEKWPRKEGARIPVSFRLEMNAGAKTDFLAKIQVPHAA